MGATGLASPPVVRDEARAPGPAAAPRASTRAADKVEASWVAAAVVLTLVLVVAPRLPGAAGQRAALVVTSFVALFTEALPFLLAGALLSAAAGGRIGRMLVSVSRRRPRMAALVAPFTGGVLPLCDCGLVPLARQLRDAGTPASAVNAFVSGAAVWNPIVVVSTLVAFPNDHLMVAGRLAVGLVVAMVVSAVVIPPASGDTCQVEHHHGEDPAPGWSARLLGEVSTFVPGLVVGALAAGLLRAALPTGALPALERQPLLAALGLMMLAFVMSICSQADAFVAASLPVGVLPRLAFLTLSPVLNLKLAALYGTVFGRRWLVSFAAVVVPTVFAACVVWASLVPR